MAGAARHALPLKSVTDAIQLRNSLLRSFEAAAAHPQLAEEGATSAAIIGGGASGVEVAGYLADFLFPTFARDYPQLDPERMRITLLELGDRLLPTFDPALSRYVLDTLGRHGVEVRLGMPVTAVDADGVTLADGGRLAAHTVVWAGGVSAPPWVQHLGLPLAHGRVVTGPDLRVPGHPTTFAVGDLAAVCAPDGRLYPQVAQVALQAGRHAARQIRGLTAGKATQPFRYRDKGAMAIIGRNAAVVQSGPLRLTGRLAWIAWGLLHLAYLPGTANRLSVAQKWRWWHLTHRSSSRVLIELADGAHTATTAPAFQVTAVGEEQPPAGM